MCADWRPSTCPAGITDYRQIALRVAERLAERGVIIQTGAAVKRLQIQPHMVVAEPQTGLHAAPVTIYISAH